MSKLDPSSFKPKKPISIDEFVAGAGTVSDKTVIALDPDAPATRSFTVPCNDYELGLLRQLAEHEEKSMRKVARKKLFEHIESRLDFIRNHLLPAP